MDAREACRRFTGFRCSLALCEDRTDIDRILTALLAELSLTPPHLVVKRQVLRLLSNPVISSTELDRLLALLEEIETFFAQPRLAHPLSAEECFRGGPLS